MKEKYTQLVTKVKGVFTRKTLGTTVFKVTRDWYIAILLSTFISVGLCGVGVYVFFFAEVENDDSEMLQISNVTFNKQQFDTVLNTYRERSSEYAELKSSVAIPAPDIGSVEGIGEMTVEEQEEEEEVEDGVLMP